MLRSGYWLGRRYVEALSQPTIHSLGVQLLTEPQEITSNLL